MTDLVKADSSYGLPVSGMAPGLAIMFNDALYERCKQIAHVMSKANGFTPRHLLGQGEACFAVVTRSITWKLDPLAVAQSTYQTPNGAVGYEGKLIQAILENSGHLVGPVTFEHFGDWSKIQGRWKKGKSAKGYEIPVQGWTDEDENGLGVTVRAQVRGEERQREFSMLLRECYPRNSTLWVLRPSQQICYTAARAFGNIAAPGLLMGVPFSGDEDEATMIDMTPSSRPSRADFDKPKADADIPITRSMPVKEEEQPLPQSQGTADVPPTPEDAVDSEYGAFEARNDGAAAFAAKRSIFSVPPEWKQLGRDDLMSAFKDGWREAEEESKSAASESRPPMEAE